MYNWCWDLNCKPLGPQSSSLPTELPCPVFFAKRIQVNRLKFQIGLLEFPDVDYQFSGLLQILNRSFIKTPVLAVAKFFAQSMLIHPNRYVLAQNFLNTVGSEIRPFKIQTFWWSDFERSCIQFVSLNLNEMILLIWGFEVTSNSHHQWWKNFLTIKFSSFQLFANIFSNWDYYLVVGQSSTYWKLGFKKYEASPFYKYT